MSRTPDRSLTLSMLTAVHCCNVCANTCLCPLHTSHLELFSSSVSSACLVKSKQFPPSTSHNSPDGQIDNSHDASHTEHFLKTEVASTIVHSALARPVVSDASKQIADVRQAQSCKKAWYTCNSSAASALCTLQQERYYQNPAQQEAGSITAPEFC